MKRQFGSEKRVILFIDTGDNCRCPMANGYLLKLLEQRGIKYIEIRTAGVMTPTGLLPTPEAVLLLQEEGVDIRRHRSRPLTGDMIKRADLVLGMTPFHVQSALRMTEEARGKTFLLKEYVGRDGRNTQIADPMGGTLEIFKKCFGEIKASLQRLVEMDIITKPPAALAYDPHRVTPAPPKPASERERERELERELETSAQSEEATASKAEKKHAKAEEKPAKKAEKAVKEERPAKAGKKPAKPAKPAKAAKTEKAAKPAKAAKAVKAAKPAKPAKAAKSAKPAKTAKTAKPAKPAKAEKAKPAKPPKSVKPAPKAAAKPAKAAAKPKKSSSPAKPVTKNRKGK